MFELGILLSLACAFVTNVALLCKHKGAVVAPAVEMARPLHTAAELFRSKWWAIGFAISFAAWALHVGALAIAPLSLVQAVIAGGLVLVAIPAERWFGHRLGRREWIGLSLSAIGLTFLVITADGGGGSHSKYSEAAMIAFEGGAVGIGLAMILGGGLKKAAPSCGALLGGAAGLLIGVSDISIKALLGEISAGPMALLSPWTACAIAASVAAFYALARGLQVGGAIQVIAVSSIAANLSTITAGIIVFGDSIGGNAFEIVARACAFAAVAGAAALMPGPGHRPAAA